MLSPERYLAKSWRPDREYLRGRLVERNLGRRDHSELQGEVFAWFHNRRRFLRIFPFVEQRIRVAAHRYRIPDVCVTHLPKPEEQVFTHPPFICIEILSPDDTFPALQQRFDDYLAMGVENLWVLDPASRRGWQIAAAGHFEALDRVLRTSDGTVALPIEELFNRAV